MFLCTHNSASLGLSTSAPARVHSSMAIDIDIDIDIYVFAYKQSLPTRRQLTLMSAHTSNVYTHE